jgi:predicted HicB family RNase H-like nuclease
MEYKNIAVSPEKHRMLAVYAAKSGKSIKKIVENFIVELSAEKQQTEESI